MSDESFLLNSIRDTANKQADIARLYRDVFIPVDDNITADVGLINRAIIARWSLAGLKRIKRMAWKL